MKKLIIILTVILSQTTQAQVKKVLFLGNSYTGVNNLPQLVKDVALSFNDTIYTDQNIPGGYQLIMHTTNATTLSKIASNNWDNVVIQEQSQKPSCSPTQVASDVYPYAQILCDSIRANYSCSEPVFYMTWGRKNGDASNCTAYPPICTYAGMQQRLRESYMQMSTDNNATTSPVGVAWKTVRDSFPLIELYNPDESHPSIYGSYLAACVFYATLYQKSPIGSTYIPAAINASDALNLQTIASNTVLDSLDLWRIGANWPTANFNYTGGGTVNFTNTSSNGVTYSWDFGDGNTSSLENPSNTYATGGNYNVQLTTFSSDNCFSDTITQNIVITPTKINTLANVDDIKIYPNPANNYIDIQTEVEHTNIIITDVTGKTIITTNSDRKIDITKLNDGIYFVQVFNKTKQLKSFKLVKH